MYYNTNFPLLEKIYRTCDSIAQISERLEKKFQKNYSLENSRLGPLKVFPSLDFIPFPNTNCFELFLFHKTKSISILIFAIPDENIQSLYDFIKLQSSTKPQKKPITNTTFSKKPAKLFHQYSDNIESLEEFKEKFYILSKLDRQISIGEDKELTSKIQENSNDEIELFNSEFLQRMNDKCSDENQVLQLENGSAYAGQTLNGLPHGVGTEFMKDGMSYKGDFRNGKCHGVGYIVNSNLDMIDAEFMNGELVGI